MRNADGHDGATSSYDSCTDRVAGRARAFHKLMLARLRGEPKRRCCIHFVFVFCSCNKRFHANSTVSPRCHSASAAIYLHHPLLLNYCSNMSTFIVGPFVAVFFVSVESSWTYQPHIELRGAIVFLILPFPCLFVFRPVSCDINILGHQVDIS